MPSAICIQVGKRIRSLRRQRGWRQIDLSEHTGISVTHLSAVERGERELCLVNIERIAKALNRQPHELLMP